MLAPQQLKIDLFDFMCLRGGGLFQVFVRPDGTVESDKLNESKTRKGFIGEKYYVRQVAIVAKRLLSFVRYNKHDGRLPEID